MAEKYVVTAKFHIRVYPNGEDKPGEDIHFAKSQIIDRSDIPDGFDPEVWKANGLIKPATTGFHAEPETAAG
jgi:hypothetical protein